MCYLGLAQGFQRKEVPLVGGGTPRSATVAGPLSPRGNGTGCHVYAAVDCCRAGQHGARQAVDGRMRMHGRAVLLSRAQVHGIVGWRRPSDCSHRSHACQYVHRCPRSQGPGNLINVHTCVCKYVTVVLVSFVSCEFRI